MSKRLEAETAAIVARIYELAGTEFNINSPKQLADILFVKLQLTPTKKTKTGFSTNVDVLEDLAHLHPLPAEILKYRTLAKLKSTYIDALPAMIHPATGRLHTSFNQTVAATGRLSSSDPNLQNIPIRTDLGREIRRAFIAEPGSQLISADYSQIELRVLAHLSGDPALVQTFIEDQDVHTRTASEIFGPAARGDHRRDAAQGKGGQLRHHLRDLGVRAGPGHRRFQRGGQSATSTAILPGIPEVRDFHGHRPSARRGRRAT